MQFLSIIVAAIATTVAAQSTQGGSCDSGTYQCGQTMNGTSTVQVCLNGGWVTSSICANGWACQMDDALGATCRD
ncbi:hypothetical protein PG990_000404 [Apiospora arundinis]|uniref:Uncharacterized protein n=1 Tax=Apiospora arundinis TaxID=335852 RepID=A0ABR2HZA0_9PEZI